MTTLYYYVVGGFLQMLVSIFGIVGNTISAIVLTRPEMKSSVNVMLLGLSLADNIYLVCRVLFNGFVACLQFFELSYKYESEYEPFIYSTVQTCLRIGQTASIYFTVAITLERFVVVHWPLKSRSICTVKTARRTSAVIFVISLLSGAPAYFAIRVVEFVASGNGTAVYMITFTDFGRSYAYQTLYLKLIFIILNYIIPFLILIIFNTAIYVKIRKTNRQRENLTQSHCAEISIAKMLLCVVCVFGICYLPTALVCFGYTNVFDHEFLFNLILFSFFTTSVNSAVNFVIYCLMSPKYRTTLMGLWRKQSTAGNVSANRSAANVHRSLTV